MTRVLPCRAPPPQGRRGPRARHARSLPAGGAPHLDEEGLAVAVAPGEDGVDGGRDAPAVRDPAGAGRRRAPAVQQPVVVTCAAGGDTVERGWAGGQAEPGGKGWKPGARSRLSSLLPSGRSGGGKAAPGRRLPAGPGGGGRWAPVSLSAASERSGGSGGSGGPEQVRAAGKEEGGRGRPTSEDGQGAVRQGHHAVRWLPVAQVLLVPHCKTQWLGVI